MQTTSVRIPTSLYEAVRHRAEEERRTAAQMLRILVEDGLYLDAKDPQRSEPWHESPEVVPVPSQAEKDFATEDPIEPEPEPDDLAHNIFVPVVDTPETVAVKAKAARAIMDSAEEHFHPDFGSKLGKKK